MQSQVDLHIHSLYSDGVYAPSALVEMAAHKGLRAIALADHDSVGGIEEALAAGERCNVEVIPAIELSVEFNKLNDIHLLGYYIDHRDPAFLDKLALFRQRRDERGRLIVARINEKLEREKKGCITYGEVDALAVDALGRPHIAQILVAHGLARDIRDAFDSYLVPCNVPKLYFPLVDALAEIRRLNGVAVLAHPTTITEDRRALKDLIFQLSALGLDGIEVINNASSNDDMMFLQSLARHMGLVITGGSDFHGFESDIEMGSGRGLLSLPYDMVEAVKLRRPPALS
ncbi:MAG: PHP domain-containing protein [Deltaproteobacteria bacterium]|nr:MAG: PHP domain-containing protein [Deltaproteobacteria bacterium]